MLRCVPGCVGPWAVLLPYLCASLTSLLAQGNPRSTAIRAVATANSLELEEVAADTKNPSPDFVKANPLHKVPTFVGADGFVLTECIAIAIYGTWYHFASSLPISPLFSAAPWLPGAPLAT
jgi:hypothetical protein